MASGAISNTFQTYQAIGNREELANAIYDISPKDTPVMTMAGRASCSATYFEWQTDALASAVTTNAVVEGHEFTTVTQTQPTVRLGNYVQTSTKDFLVSDIQEKVNKAGRGSEIGYQWMKVGAELKRDIESTICNNQARAAGTASTIRYTGTLLAFLLTNTDSAAGAGGSDTNAPATPAATRTDGTQRTFTETIHKSVLSQMWASGSNIDNTYVFVGAFNKDKISSFSGIADRVFNLNSPKQATIVGAADVYVSNFGTVKVLPHRFMRTRDALYLDPSYLRVRYLEDFHRVDLARTSLGEKRALVATWGLEVSTEKAHGIAADLTTS